MKKLNLFCFIVFAFFAIIGSIAYFNCLRIMPDDPTDLQLACFGFGFSFWPMILGYLGIISLIAEKIRSKLQPVTAPNINSEDQQFTGPAE